MWFCFFPPLSKAIQEHYCYSLSSSSRKFGKQNPLMDMGKKEGTATVLLLKVPPESWSRKKAAKGTTTTKKITQPFQSQRQSSVLCWLLQLRKIPVYADRYFFFFSALPLTGLCKQQDAHLQQRPRHALETPCPWVSPGLSDWLQQEL